MSQHLEVVVSAGMPAQCPQCRMWFEPHAYTRTFRSILCWCDNWVDIFYVDYVIEEIGFLM